MDHLQEDAGPIRTTAVDDPADSVRRRSPGRPRDPQAEQRILDAAIEEYLDRGAAGFTMDGVARRAGVGKSTVYLRWPDRDQLLVQSVLARSSRNEDVDTGSLHGDLLELCCNVRRFLSDPVGFATFRLTVDAVANPAYRHVAETLAQEHRRAALRIFERAAARGEKVRDDAVSSVIECLYGAVAMKVLSQGFEAPLASAADVEASCRATVDVLYSSLSPA